MATLIINEYVDVIEHSVMGKQLTFKVNCDFYKTVIGFKNKTGFNLLFYVSDNVMNDIIIGIEKYENCIIFNMDDKLYTFCIEGSDKEFFNLSQKGKIRKFKIDELLGE